MPAASPPDLRLTVAQNIARLRRARGLSAGELARRAGVGKATLSRIEAGTHNPTIETLHAITTALQVPLGAPLHDTSAPEVHSDGIDAELVTHLDDPEGTTELYRVTIAAGQTPHPAASSPSLRKTITVFTGTLTITSLAGTRTLRPNESATWWANTPETYASAGEQAVTAAILLRHITSALAAN
jgi:transcriptional regulator with XRE-family HTH domain